MDSEPTFKVYKHTAPNGKVYFGITSQPVKRRWQRGHGYAGNEHFTRAIMKYGWDNIRHEVLFTGLSMEIAVQLEKYLITEYKSYNPAFGYNMYIGGGPIRKCCWQTRAKMSRAAVENDNADRLHTKEVVAKRAISQKGRVVSAETRRRIGDSHRGAKSVSAKRVLQLDLSGNVLRLWSSIMGIEREYGYKNASISRCCKGKRPTAYGYIWRYADGNA